MNGFASKLYTFSYGFLQIFSLLFIGFLFLGSFLFTCYAENMETQQVLTKWDNPLWNLLGMAAFLLFLFGVCVFIAKIMPKFLSGKILLLLTCAWIAFTGAILILFGKTVPAADGMSVYGIAQALAEGDTSVIHPMDSYLSYYPQQVGLVAFYELLIRFWRLLPVTLPAYHFIKCVNVVLACIIVVFQYKTVRLVWKDELTDKIYLLLAGTNLPFLMYTSFVYGEIPSFAAVSMAFYCLAVLWKRSSLLHGTAALICLTLGVLLRKNSLILVIAVLIVSFFQWLKNRRAHLLLFPLVCGISCFFALPLIQKAYELRADNTLSSGVPAISYFAMGMQESTRGNGWYNGFNFNTYYETGMDAKATAALSKKAVSQRLAYFKENPGYAAEFYLGKHLSQWADGTYAARQATLATFGGRQEFFNSLYAGEYSRAFIGFCDVWQNVLYLGAFLFCLGGLTGLGSQTRTGPNPKSLAVYLDMIGVIGGFLFHCIWEANSRYIFLYGLLLMPYAAKGLSDLWQTVTSIGLQKFAVQKEALYEKTK